MEGVGQQQGNRGPEEAEHREQAGVIQRAPLQDRRIPSQFDHGRQQGAVVQAWGGPARRQSDPQYGGQHRHHRRRREEHGVPGRGIGQQARRRARLHDAEHQPAHDIADDAAPCRLGRQVRGIGHQDLNRDGAKPDQPRRGQEVCPCRGQGGADQGECCEPEQDKDQPTVLDQVAQRCDEQETHAVADLRHRHDQACSTLRQAERGADGTGQRLGVVDVGGNQAATGREQQGEPGRDAGVVALYGG